MRFFVCLLLIFLDLWTENEIFGYKVEDRNLTVHIQANHYENDQEGNIITVERILPFQFNVANPELDLIIEEFCRENKVSREQCDHLFQQIIQIRYDFVEQELIQTQLLQNLSIINTQFIPNKHLQRSAFAMNTEINNHFQRKLKYESIMGEISIITEEIIHLLRSIQNHLRVNDNASNQLNMSNKYITFIHSCSIAGENNRILLELLHSIISSGLIKKLHLLLVFNYGNGVTDEVSRLMSDYSNMKLFQVTNDTSYFEVPTMMIMHDALNKAYSEDVSFLLYLHTKGVSYREIYPQIEDWRAMMLYFLVERYPTCLSLLSSGAFDAVGVNYKSNPRDFRGNFWWTTSSYFQRLPPLDFLHTNKYTAEKWLHLGSPYRVYNLHESNVDHHFATYSRTQYVHSDVTVSIDDDESALCTGYSVYWQKDMKMQD